MTQKLNQNQFKFLSCHPAGKIFIPHHEDNHDMTSLSPTSWCHAHHRNIGQVMKIKHETRKIFLLFPQSKNINFMLHNIRAMTS